MKNLISIFLTVITLSSYAENEKIAGSKITGVSVFLSKAQINRSATTSVQPGMTDIILSELSHNIDPNSIQVTGKGDVVIMSVSHRLNHLNKAAKSDKIKTLVTQKKNLEDANVVVRYKKEALQEEKKMILSNKSIGGANSGVNWEQLENIADFYRERLIDISEKWTVLDKDEKSNNKNYKDVVQQINSLTTSLNKPTSEIIVKVHSKSAEGVKLNFNYLVYNAGWTPLYDFRASDGDKNIDISFRANVFQNSGVDWSNVPITLSTGNPSLGVEKPELNPWYLHLQEIHKQYSKKSLSYGSAPSSRNIQSYSRDDASNEILEEISVSNVTSRTASNFINTNMKQLTTEYEISINQSVSSNNKKHMMNVKEFKVEAEFEHATVPKLDKDAFLMANMINWTDFDWISSEINVFYDDTYIGRSFLDVSSIEDTLSLSLGRDKKVVIERQKIKDFCKIKSIGLNKKKLVGYEITVRNNKQTEILLNLRDQIPVSQHEQIEVSIIDVSGAKKEVNTGFLDWDLKLKPGESKTVEIKFEVKYPRKYIVRGL